MFLLSTTGFGLKFRRNNSERAKQQCSVDKLHVSFDEARTATHALAFASVGNAMFNWKFLM